MNLPALKDLEIKSGARILVRAGFDVPVERGQVQDDFRIRGALPTLDFLVGKDATPIIICHLGRPSGWDENSSIEPVAKKLAEVWKRKFIIVDEKVKQLPDYPIPHLYFFKIDILKHDFKKLLDQMRAKDAAIFENLRFYEGEEANDPEFAKKLASFGRAYVNEAFSASHRKHASIDAITKFLPAVAGFEFAKEISALGRVLVNPKKPVVIMMGGIKLSDKAPAVSNLAKLSDHILLGGGLASLFFKIRGFNVGKSVLAEVGEEKVASEIWRNHKDKIKLPLDVVVSTAKDGEPECVLPHQIKPHQMILDIGPKTIQEYSKYIKEAKTLVWNGPMGYFESKQFSHGTFALARLFASRTKTSVFGLVGGGETLEVIRRGHLDQYIDHVSSGGGAMLDFLAGRDFPGLEALLKSKINVKV
ncbi:MAG: phosphoglycerate kinase [Candidatus Doudnabacteria bacterium]|nr:phosphoglycerate kinase [bacterium]MDZ4244189.1 phosphoglycerate kinase [Candidatus Doudnabacteria bacterium]